MSGGPRAPPCLSPATSLKIELDRIEFCMYGIDFDHVSKRLQFVSNLLYRNDHKPVLSHQTLQSCRFFLYQKDVKRSAFQNKRVAVWQLPFRAQKILGTLENYDWIGRNHHWIFCLCYRPLLTFLVCACGIPWAVMNYRRPLPWVLRRE